MKLWMMVAILAVGFLAFAYVYRASKPEERSFTMAGKTKVVCGWKTVPFDTHVDRTLARGTERDCGIFPGSPRTGFMPVIEH